MKNKPRVRPGWIFLHTPNNLHYLKSDGTIACGKYWFKGRTRIHDPSKEGIYCVDCMKNLPKAKTSEDVVL